MKINISRRTFLASSVILAVSQYASKAIAKVSSTFNFEIKFTDEEWKKRLTPEEYRILREGGTERPKSSPLWKEKTAGKYHCKGCNLEVYSSKFKVILNKGWVFFRFCQPDSVLTGIDESIAYSGSMIKKHTTEAHCRRCGSHLGHILYVDRKILHCVNGASLRFKPSV